MKAGSLVAMPDSRVAEVRELWRNPGRTSAWVRPIDGARSEAFGLDELVELAHARKIRPYPTAEVDTRWGTVEVRATAETATCYGRRCSDRVFVMCPKKRGGEAVCEFRPIRVHRVEYTLSGALGRNVETEAWEIVDYFRLYRYRGRGEPTWNAGKAVRDALPAELSGWLEQHPYFLEEARRVRLSNEIAEVEGDILAAKLRFREAHRRREELLAREVE